MKVEDMTFGTVENCVEFSDDSKHGKLRVKIFACDSDQSARLRLDAYEVVQLRDWLNRILANDCNKSDGGTNGGT